MKSIIFCDNCGKPMHHSTLQGDNKLWYCPCGFMREYDKEVGTVEKISKKEVGKGVAKKKKTLGFPHKCSKCGYSLADVETISAFYSDESDISLYKCKKCGHVVRETDGTSNAF